MGAEWDGASAGAALDEAKGGFQMGGFEVLGAAAEAVNGVGKDGSGEGGIEGEEGGTISDEGV